METSNNREFWWVKNVSKFRLTFGDIPKFPALKPGQIENLLKYSTKEEVGQSKALVYYVSKNFVEFNKVIDNTSESISSENVSQAITSVEEDEMNSKATNYYTKLETYNKEEVDQLISQSGANLIIVKKDPLTGQFSSIAAALNSITNSGENNRYVIQVQPGNYTEPVCNIPEFCYVIGSSIDSVVVSPDGNHNIFELNNRSGIQNLTIQNAPSGYCGILAQDIGNFCTINKVSIYNCDIGIFMHSINVESNLFLEYVDLTNSTTNCIYNKSENDVISFLNCENLYIDESSNVSEHNAIKIEGTGSQMVIQGFGAVDNACIGNCILITDGGYLDISSARLEDWNKAILVDNVGDNAYLKLNAIDFDDNDYDFYVDNPTCEGYFLGESLYNKHYINKEAPFFIANKPQNVISVATKGGDFTSIKDAMDSISDSGYSNRYVIEVAPGNYIENTISLKDYVTVTGEEARATVISLNDSVPENINLFENGNTVNSTLRKLYLKGASEGAVFKYYGGVCRLEQIRFASSKYGVDASGVNGEVQNSLDISNCSCARDSDIDVLFKVSDDGTNSLKVIISHFDTNDSETGLKRVAEIGYGTGGERGINTHIEFVGCSFSGDGTDTAITIADGCDCHILATQIMDFNNGIYVPNAGNGPEVEATGSLIYDNATYDVLIENPLCEGVLQIEASREKISINENSNISVLILGNTDGSLSLGGDLYQGNSFSSSTNITEAINKSTSLGVTEGGNVSLVSGRYVSIQAGSGYLMLGSTSPNNIIKYIEWNSSVIQMPANSNMAIYIDDTGAIKTSSSLTDIYTNIFLARIVTDSSNILLLANSLRDNIISGTKYDRLFRQYLGAIYNSGSISSAVNNTQISVTSGNYAFSTRVFAPSGGNPISFSTWYPNTLTSWFNITTNINNVPFEWYDQTANDGDGGLVTIADGKFAKHALYLFGEGAIEKYYLVYGQSQFDSKLEAEAGGLPPTPNPLSLHPVLIASVIVQKADATALPDPIIDHIEEIVDLRPTLITRVGSVTSATVHGNLSGLEKDDHPQYLLVDGARAMSGDLNMANNDILNIGTLNGITVESHVSRHLPNGLDPLPTSAPNSNLSSSSTNFIGIQNIFSRSDHTHAITTSSSNVSSAIVSRDSSGNFSAGTITSNLIGNITGNVTGSVSGSSATFTTALTGDVTGGNNGGSTTVALVGGSSASNVHSAELLANAATDLNTPSTIVKRDASGNFSAGTITGNLIGNTSGSSSTFTTSLIGDVIGGNNGGSTTVASVGGSSASNVHLAELAANAATNLNTASTIVKRDASGNFNAGTITANLTGNASGSSSTFTTALTGDVTGGNNGGSTIVASVGGSSASNIHSAELLANAATSLDTASAIVKRDSSGNFSAGTITSNLIGNITGNVTGSVSGSSATFTTALTGDVTGGNNGGSTTVASVGGSSASNVHSAELAANAATSLDTASAIVKRDSSGNFSAGTITSNLIGNVTGNVSGSSATFTTALTGDVAGGNNGGSTTVASVGGSSASNVHSAELAANAATNLNTASTIVKRDSSGNFNAGTITSSLIGNVTGNVSGSSAIFTTALTGDVTGGNNGGSTTVASVGGSSASNVHLAELAANAATNLNTASTIVKRDASGNFSAGTITANLTGNVSGNASNVTGIVAVANGGTNSNTSLNNNRIIISLNNKIVETSAINSNLAIVSDSNGLPIGSTTTANEIGYLHGVTSSVQTQISNKADSSALSSHTGNVSNPHSTSLEQARTINNMLSGNIDANSNTIINISTPHNNGDAANKAYVDALASGLTVKDPVLSATTTNLSTNYDNINLTLTSTANEVLSIDTVSLSLTNRVLVKDQNTQTQNGIYTVTNIGKADPDGYPWVLTRASDFNSSDNIKNGSFVLITQGYVNLNAGYVLTSTPPITLDVTSLIWKKYSQSNNIQPGVGLALNGTAFDVQVDNSTIDIANNKIEIKSNSIGESQLNKSSISLSGFGLPSANIDMNQYKITNLFAPSSNNDAARKLDVDTVQGNLTLHIGSGGTAHAEVTTSTDGFMIAADKLKLDSSTANNTASAIVKRDSSGNFSAGTITASLTGNILGNVTGNVTGNVSGSSATFTTALTGDVTGGNNGGSTTVASVGGSSASNVHSAELAANAATNLNTVSTIVKRDSSGNFNAGAITASLIGNVTGNVSGSSATFTTALTGDVIGGNNGGSTTVALVGGSSASNIHSAELLANAATNLNTASTIVKRDASGNFSAGTITSNLIGNITGNVTGSVSGSSATFTTALTGDVTGGNNGGSTIVASVGGSSASNIHSAELLANAATSLNTASTIVKRDSSGNFNAGTITSSLIGNVTGNVSGSSATFTTALTGDVTGGNNGGSTTVALVGGSSASNIHSAELLANAATNLNTASTIVKRDASGNFSAGTITSSLTGNVTGNVSGSSATFTTALTGDVTGGNNGGSTTVASVGGSSASNIHSAELLANAATNLNASSTIVKRDSSGNFTAGTITANLTGNISGSSATFTTALTGDVTGGNNGGSTTVALVGGSSASNVHSAELAANAATNLNTASTIVKRDSSGNFTAGTITSSLIGNVTGNVSGSSATFTTALTGDVTGGNNGGSTTVASVGGSSASNIHSAELLANAATSLNTASTIVKRDASGNFNAGTITANLIGNVTGDVTGNLTGTASGNVPYTGATTNVDLGANNLISSNVQVNANLVSPEQALSVTNGTNNNLSVPNGRFFRVSTPTNNFTITGLTGGVDGREIIIWNSTTNNMTISNESASSTVSNRITTMTGNNISTTGAGIVRLIYSGSTSRWICLYVTT